MASLEGEEERVKRTHSEPSPPWWAEAVLRSVLKPEDRESVSGDLLEEYREAIVSALGPAADRWYLRQVASFLFRPSWPWGAILGAALVIRYLFDTLVPPADYLPRSQVSTYTLIAACAISSCYNAYRTQSIFGGILVAITAAVMGGLLSILGTAAMLTIWHDPATLDAWKRSGGLDEALVVVPLIMVAVSATIGFVGAVCGRSLAAFRQS
jgi:hypothetical protein